MNKSINKIHHPNDRAPRYFKRLLFPALVCVLACANPVHGSSPAANPFEVKESPMLSVNYKGTPLIDGDTMSYLSADRFPSTGTMAVTRRSGWYVVNTWSNSTAFQYRREVGVRADRVELTVQINLPAYANDPAKLSNSYTFMVPIERLLGTKWTALTGLSRSSETNGVLNAATPNGSLLGASARWIAFEGTNGKIVFDLNPKGISSSSSYGPNDVLGLWSIEKTATHIRFSFGGSARVQGGVYTAKAVIFEGTHADYKNWHSNQPYSYYNTLPTKYRFSFGTAKPGKEYTPADLLPYTKERGYGWKTVDGLSKLAPAEQGVIWNAVASDQNNTFICDIAQPGLYLVTLRSRDRGKDPCRFQLAANGIVKVKDLTIPKGTIKTVTWSAWLPKGAFKLDFEGRWAVSSVALQMLLHQEEDFAFNRGVWLVDEVYEPTPVNSNASLKKPVNYKVVVSELDVPPEIVDPAAMPRLPEKETLLPPQSGEAMAWRYNTFIGGMGPDNTGTFLEFDTPEKISRRLAELKAQGINTILLNGFLARHCHGEHLPRVQKNIKEITQIAHSMGMKVLDHQDLTIVWNKETALRHLVENIDWAQRTLDGNLPNQGRCPINANFKKAYFAWMRQFVKDTKIDGIMIDEVCFHGSNFCGCEDCRRQFTAETGLVLPVDETSPLLMNRKSNLWKAWLEWRRKAIGDWWVALRREIQSVQPNFCIMGYVSEGGFVSSWAPLDLGYDLIEMARSNDLLGTEIMTRNVMDCYRYVFASRKMYNILREAYGSPTFGLVYALKSANFAYFGWAMNNMNGQVTWMFYDKQKGQEGADYISWKENMDRQLARPVADVAILYSRQSRDWPQWSGHSADVLGVSEILDDHHIQNVILTETSIVPEKIKSYRLLILPSACSLSDAVVETIRQYVAQGGRILILGHTGMLDEIGNMRPTWAFADMIGAAPGKKFEAFPKDSLLDTPGGVPVAFPMHILKLTVSDSKRAETILNVVKEGGAVLAPAGVTASFGKGKVFYCAPQLGAANFQNQVAVDSKWTFELNQPLAGMLLAITRNALGDAPLSFEAKAIPEQVLATVYRQEVKGRQSTSVHLLSATGVTIRKGDTLPSEKSKPAFPPLAEDMVFEIDLPSFPGESYAASPDFEGHKPVGIQKVGKTRYRITVPKDCLKTYTLVWLHTSTRSFRSFAQDILRAFKR